MMLLLRKLLRRELVKLHHLSGNTLGVTESLGEKHELCNKTIVGDHHCHWSEKNFKVIWKLSSTGISWVHCDMASEFWLKWNLIFLEVENLLVVEESISYLKKLLSYHREYLNENSVELIETGPASLLAKT